ncbi:MAG: hypothetical protein HYW23_03930 [Candidatus Aenigmarchaeota archaeon]|nr:hypothetical protein [Candidatus Aenigmarchaeota archaeon]
MVKYFGPVGRFKHSRQIIVMEKGQAWLPWIIFGVPFAIFLFLLVSGFAANQPYEISSALRQGGQLPEPLQQLLTGLNVPLEWQYIPAIFYLFAVPFFSIMIITYGFLSQLNIFQFNNFINWILAFFMTFLTLPFNLFVRIVYAMLAAMGMYGVFAFGALFVLGVGWIFLRQLGPDRWGYTNAGTYQGLRLEDRYNRMRTWLIHARTQNHAHANVGEITTALTEADNNWAGNHREAAVHRLSAAVGFVTNPAHGFNTVGLGPAPR